MYVFITSRKSNLENIPSKRLYNGSIVHVPHGTVVVVFVLLLVVVFVFVIVIVPIFVFVPISLTESHV